MKKTSHIPTESIEQQHFKKKYLTRKQQEDDAEKEIRAYSHETAPLQVRETSNVAQKREL